MVALNPDKHLPVDPDVRIPDRVKAQAAAADAYYAPTQAGEPPAPSPEPVPPPAAAVPAPAPAPEPAPAPQPAPALSQPPDRSGVDPNSWEGRYYSMEGRFRQAERSKGAMEQQLSEMSEELSRITDVAEVRRPVGSQRPAGEAPRLLTEKDVETYGHDLLEVMKRAAREAVAPDLSQVAQTVQRTTHDIQADKRREMWATIAGEVPNFQEINYDPRFKMWCRLPDVYSGQLRGALLNAALRAADAPRAVAIFKGFLAEEQATGQAPAPQPATVPPAPVPEPRQPAVSLETLAAPGRPKPATGNTQPAAAADQPLITRAQIKWFYSQEGHAHYAGREQDRLNDEARIFAAQKAGRIQG